MVEAAARTERTPPPGMQTGAFALIDALGFKGIWQGQEPAQVLATLDAISLAVDIVAKRFHEEAGFQAAFLSDTIALGVALGTPHTGHSLLTLVHLVRAICGSAAMSPVPLAYRGCITFGDFLITKRFLIGRAVDEAATYHEQSDAAVVWFAPDAHRRYVELSKGGQVEGLPVFDVPMKGGGVLATTTVSPFPFDCSQSDADNLATAILATFDPRPGVSLGLDIAIKKQNTARFLRACMQARGLGWKPTI